MPPFALLLAGALLQTPPPPSVTIIEPVLYDETGSITPRESNRRNLESIVDCALRPDVTAVIIKAHTDTVGTAGANLALARARGQAVADRLVAEGVPPAIIRIDARGETQLARPTADGVAEPLNRRVWVDVQSGIR
jgi:outer membrane protein OmpA-like peptidoglycan-associated protein